MFRSFFILIAATATLTSFLNSASFAQEYFYYSRGQKIAIAASQEKISVKFKRGITEEQIERFMLSEAG